MMIMRYLVIALVAGVNLISVASVVARGYSRQQVKSMPILERPSRVGHFYGNSVRRRASREPSQPAAHAPSRSMTVTEPTASRTFTPLTLMGRGGEY